MKVAYFDDDSANLQMFKTMLKDSFELDTFQDPTLYDQILRDNKYSAILVDIYMPVIDGLELYSTIVKHSCYNGCPIIFVSSDNSEEAKLKSLSAGGVDFFSRSMRPEEIMLRLKNKIDAFRKYRPILELGSLRMETHDLKTFLDDKLIDTTLTEMKILCILMRNSPDITSREQLTDYVWPEQKILPQTLNTHLSNLRQKLSSWDYEVVNVKNKGYYIAKKS